MGMSYHHDNVFFRKKKIEGVILVQFHVQVETMIMKTIRT